MATNRLTPGTPPTQDSRPQMSRALPAPQTLPLLEAFCWPLLCQLPVCALHPGKPSGDLGP